MSLGLLSGLFDGLKYRQDRRAIAHEFGLDETVLRSFAHHVTYVRNICAHHARLWNRRFAITTKVPNSAEPDLRESLAPSEPRSPYNTLVLFGHCLRHVSVDGRWHKQLTALIEDYPRIDTAAMGFPSGWRSRPLWRR